MTNEELKKQRDIRTDDLIYQIQRHKKTIANIVRDAYERGLADGKRNPNAPTNGDMIMMMFPNITIKPIYSDNPILIVNTVTDDFTFRCTEDWWNSPYTKNGKELIC